MDIKYLKRDEILQIHTEIMEKEEDISVLNPNQLEITIDRIQWTYYNREEDFFDKCAIIFRDIVSGHIFTDGNKRTGFAVLHLFLKRNGYDIKRKRDDNKERKLFVNKIKDKVIDFLKKLFLKTSETYFAHIWEFTLKVASEEIPISEIKEWIINISEKI